ncbi:MAG TPA: hypothetical protein VK152_09925 [Paludibacter sp.]|nr:hypothetical protein [Paludibacter sp.]
MKPVRKLKIFRKAHIGHLKRLYQKSIGHLLDNGNWKSISGYTGEKTNSLLKWGSDLNIFKAPAIVGIKIIYHKSLAFLFDSSPKPAAAMVSEDNYLYRDLSGSEAPAEKSEKELKIFKYPTIESLKTLYNKSIGKL